MKPKILSMGTMYLDINCFDFPFNGGLMPETETVGSGYEVVPGGSALNFARVCAAIGLPPVFVGKAGQDKQGRLLEELISETGIVPALIHSPAVSTVVGMNFVSADSRTIMAVVGTANKELSASEIKDKVSEYIGEIEYLYMGGCFKLKSILPHLDSFAEIAKANSIKVVLDHGRVTNSVARDDIAIIKKLLPLVDYYLPSKDELLSVWDSLTIEDAIKKVTEASEATIAVKDGESGAVGYAGGKYIKVPAFKVETVNTIGAGDSFNAGFIKAQDTGMDFEASIRFGCATAALKISRKELPTLEAINQIIE